MTNTGFACGTFSNVDFLKKRETNRNKDQIFEWILHKRVNLNDQ